MQIKIEPVKSNEAQMLADVSTSCFYDTFYNQNTEENMKLFLEKSFNVNVLQQELMQRNNYFFFARLNDEIIGYLKLSDAETPEKLKEYNAIEIARIYIVKEKIGLGAGKNLIDFAVYFAQQMSRQAVWLGVWEQNSRAINFYRKNGFERFGEHIFMVGNDAQTDWLMKKDLT